METWFGIFCVFCKIISFSLDGCVNCFESTEHSLEKCVIEMCYSGKTTNNLNMLFLINVLECCIYKSSVTYLTKIPPQKKLSEQWRGVLGCICVTKNTTLSADWSAVGHHINGLHASINTNDFSGVGAPGECPLGPDFINNTFPLQSINENSAKI